jgi:uncharacterized membrane protein
MPLAGRRAVIGGTIAAMQVWLVFKFIHILAVISAVGANATYQFWYSRAGRDSAQLVWTIESIRVLDRRIANPSYIVALLAGIATVITGSFSFESLWIAASIGLYVLVAVIGIALYAPAMRRQQALAAADPTSPDYEAAATRSRMLGGLATGLVLVIVVLMVLKPTL